MRGIRKLRKGPSNWSAMVLEKLPTPDGLDIDNVDGPIPIRITLIGRRAAQALSRSQKQHHPPS